MVKSGGLVLDDGRLLVNHGKWLMMVNIIS